MTSSILDSIFNRVYYDSSLDYDINDLDNSCQKHKL